VKNIIKVALILLGIFLFKISSAQKITIVDASSHEVLANSTLTLSKKCKVELSIKNFKDGIFEIENLEKSGNCILVFECKGYRSAEIKLSELNNKDKIMALYKIDVKLDEIIVSAAKFDQKISEVPMRIEVIGKEKIEFNNSQNTADLLTQSSQVFVQKSQQGGGSPVLRGFEANKVLLEVDGIRLNNSIYRGGHLQSVLRIDQEMLEKVEILNGPGSVIFGSDALGGVINFVTKRPELNKDFKVVFKNRLSTVNSELSNRISISKGFRKWALLLSASSSEFGDLMQGEGRSSQIGDLGLRTMYQQILKDTDVAAINTNPNLQRSSNYSQEDLSVKILFQPKINIRHIVNFQYSNSSNVTRYDRLTETNKSGVFKYAEWYYGPEKRLLVAYNFEIEKATIFYDKMKFTYAFQQLEESRNSRNWGSKYLGSRNEEIIINTVNLDLHKKINSHEFKYGVEISADNVSSKAIQTQIYDKSVLPLSTRYPDGGSGMQSLNAYALHTYILSPTFLISDGLRVGIVKLGARFNNKQFFPFLENSIQQQNLVYSGSIGVVKKFEPGIKVFSRLSTAYRVPNVDDLAKTFDSKAAENVIVPNPRLKPEYTVNYEIGADVEISKAITLNAVFYYTHLLDVITLLPSKINNNDSVIYDGSMTGVISNQNAGMAFIYGFSGGAEYRITTNLLAAASVNYNYGRIVSDTNLVPLDHIPPLFGKVSLMFENKFIKAEIISMFNSAKRLEDYNLQGEDNFQYATWTGLPAWTTLNFRLSKVILKDMISADVGVDNIFDKNYRIFSSGISAPGRNFWISVKIKI